MTSMPRSELLATPFNAGTRAAEVIAGVDLSGRRALVTGGGSGIGAETVRALASAGAEVTIATRRPEAAETFVQELSDSAGAVGSAVLDLCDLDSVNAFTRAWRGPLDILVANAGIMALPDRAVSAEGWEMQLATNYLGHFALAAGLRPALRDAGSARIVIVSSGAHRGAPFDFEDPQFERRAYDPWVAYGQSKSAGVLFAVGARRWAADGITANSLNPGFILTRLQRHVDDDTMRAFGVMDADGEVKPLSYYKTPEQGAATSVLLAASPLVNGITGRYFEDNQEARTVAPEELLSDELIPAEAPPGGVAAHALDPASADRLWDYASDALRRVRR